MCSTTLVPVRIELTVIFVGRQTCLPLDKPVTQELNSAFKSYNSKVHDFFLYRPTHGLRVRGNSENLYTWWHWLLREYRRWCSRLTSPAWSVGRTELYQTVCTGRRAVAWTRCEVSSSTRPPQVWRRGSTGRCIGTRCWVEAVCVRITF